MSLKAEIEEWLQEMGSNSEIPSSLQKICRPSTARIWEQLVTNAKPKQEVDFKQKNIILNKFPKRHEFEERFICQNKVIGIYLEAQKLERRVEKLEKINANKEEENGKLFAQSNKIYFDISKVKSVIEEKKKTEFLYKIKCQDLESKIHETKESLQCAKNLTPVEIDDSPNSNEITKTLQECAEKLQKLSQESFMKNKTSKLSTFTPLKENKQKKPRESLGLLPDFNLNDSDDIDCFLLTPTNASTVDLNLNSEDCLERLINNKQIKDDLKQLLHHCNRYLLVTECLKNAEELLKKLDRIFTQQDRRLLCVQEDLTKLYFIHVKVNLEKEKCAKILNKQQAEKIVKSQETVMRQKRFLQCHSTCLNRARQCDIVRSKIYQTKEEIVTRYNKIEELINRINTVWERIKNSFEENFLSLKNAGSLCFDSRWTKILEENVNVQEMKAFELFPLTFNGMLKADGEISKNYCDITPPVFLQLDSEETGHFQRLVPASFLDTEKAIFDGFRCRLVREIFKELVSHKQINNNIDLPEYSLVELKQRDAFVNDVVAQFMSLRNSPAAREVLAAPAKMNELLKLWKEMKFVDFTSEERRVDGHGFKYYKRVFEEKDSN